MTRHPPRSGDALKSLCCNGFSRLLFLGHQRDTGNDRRRSQSQHHKEGQLDKHGSDAQNGAADNSDDQKQFFSHGKYLRDESFRKLFGDCDSAIRQSGVLWIAEDKAFLWFQDTTERQFCETSLSDEDIKSFLGFKKLMDRSKFLLRYLHFFRPVGDTIQEFVSGRLTCTKLAIVDADNPAAGRV